MTNTLRRIRFKLSYDNILIAVFALVYFLDVKCLCLIKYSRAKDLNALELMAPLFVGLFMLMLFSKVGREYLNRGRFVTSVLIYTVLVVIITAVYSMRTYSESVLDIFIASFHFFILFATPLLFYLFQRSEKTMHNLLKVLVFLGVASSLVAILQGVCSQLHIRFLLPGSYQFGGYRYGRIRLSPTNLARFSALYLTYKFIAEREKRLLTGMCASVGLFSIIYYGSTRMDMIAFAVCIAMMLYFAGSKKKVYSVLLILAVVVFLSMGYASVILESFSESGENGASTTARMGAIQYFLTYFKKNPLLGMGYVVPRSPSLTRIWSGPYGVYYFDDLGLMGGLFHYGIMGIVINVLPLARLVYIAVKLLIMKRSEGIWAIGVITYILVSQISLNYLDYQRTLIFPLYWALFEVLYINESYTFNRTIGKAGE